MLVGRLFYPDDSENDHKTFGGLSFTAPLVLWSLQGGMARSCERWYRLGRPSALAKDSIRRLIASSGV